jgi:hypothetical protein
MASENVRLPSVHYTPSLLRNIEDELRAVEDDLEFEYGVPRPGGFLEVGDLDELEKKMVDSEVKYFHITGTCDKGDFVIGPATSSGDPEHHMIVVGEEKWKDSIIRRVCKIVENNQSSKLRTFMTPKYIKNIQYTIILLLVFWDIRYFWPLFGVPYHLSMPIQVQIMTLVGIAIVVSLEGIDRLYPYVSLRKENEGSRLYRLIAHLAMVGSIFGLFVGIISVWLALSGSA